MLIFGIRARAPKVESLDGERCIHCANETVRAVIYQRYLHVLWIPVVPVRRTRATECSHCKRVRAGKEIDESLLQAVSTADAKLKTPLWMFAGIPIVAVFIALGLVSERSRREQTRELVASPLESDRYVVNLLEPYGIGAVGYPYVILKLVERKGTSLEFLCSATCYRSAYEARSACAGVESQYVGFFHPTRIGFTIDEMIDLHAQGRVDHVARD